MQKTGHLITIFTPSYFDSHDVFVSDANYKHDLLNLLQMLACPINDRGDNFFIIFLKPGSFMFRMATVPAQEVYQNLAREKLPDFSILKKNLARITGRINTSNAEKE